MNAPVLETDRLVMRAPAPQDEAAYMAFYMDQRSQYAGGPQEQFRASLTFMAMLGHWQTRGFGMFATALKGDDRVIGAFGPFYPDGWPEREIGWLLFDAADEGKGLASEAAKASRHYAYDTLGWEGAVSYIDPKNAASIKVANRLAEVSP